MLPAWELATLQLCLLENGQAVNVSESSDLTFDKWIAAQGVPVDDAGIPEWSFDDRLDVICYGIENGLQLTFLDESSNPYILAKLRLVVDPANNSAAGTESIQQELANNSPSELISELFQSNEVASEADTRGAIDLMVEMERRGNLDAEGTL